MEAETGKVHHRVDGACTILSLTASNGPFYRIQGFFQMQVRMVKIRCMTRNEKECRPTMVVMALDKEAFFSELGLKGVELGRVVVFVVESGHETFHIPLLSELECLFHLGQGQFRIAFLGFEVTMADA